MEMKHLVERTGGYLLLTDSFNTDVFKHTFLKIFSREATGALKMAFNATMEVYTSSDIKVSGAIGPGSSLSKKNSFVSDTEIGMSKTTAWCTASVDNNSTYAVYFDVTNQNADNKVRAVVQFQTRYQHSSGRIRLRVTTVSYPYAEVNNLPKYIQGFDQEAAAVIMARWAVFRSETEETIDVIRWLDRTLIRLVAKFGDYQAELPHTFKLCKEFTYYPQFMFHLRRSQFLQTFNVSPDESAHYRTVLQRENVTNSLVMIQPALLEYSFDSPYPKPVLLDISSLKANIILLLDTFFNVLIWHGDTIVEWKKAGYQENPEYEHFKTLLQMPLKDAHSIVEERFPVPRLTVTDSGKGAERLLKAKVNPGGMSQDNAVVEKGHYITDDVSLKVFMDHLIKLAVQG
jgi:protein transport protein SEC23